MKRRILPLLACLLWLPFGAFAKAPVALFYMMESQKSIASFEAHVDKIDLLVPTWYGVDANGLVSGGPDDYVLKIAKAHKLPVMPIISAGGDREKFHALLGNETAKKAMIDALLSEAKLHGYSGFQFDFENIDWTDRDRLTLLTKQTYEALHKHGLQLSMAVVPKEKLSLGIGLYGYHWYAGNPVGADGKENSNISASYIDADESFPLAKRFNVTMQWDPVEHESWFYFYRDQMREWVFLPDARAFRDRYDVTKKYGLQGFCAWVLGAEDPKIWDELPNASRE